MPAPERGTTVGAGTIALTLLALVAFASNSLLTRLALGTHQLDAATFTAIRLAAGAVTLAILTGAGARSLEPLRGAGIAGPLALFAYAAPFSFAYGRIGAAVGALVLFGVVQLTMIGYALARGEHPTPAIWLGLVLAAGGLAALAAPSVTRPDPLGVLLMAVAGV
ncbi:MAG TPA: EamA family transporter, partial [Gemmatimonadaceae bacterium]|nr:EamA family transporter [Gemmatimonadaceae bacterium]